MTAETLVIDDDDRYARFRLISWWDQRKLSAAKVMVVGAGALGNEVLKNLALLGVGTIYLIDFDRIENSNLTRSVLFRARDCGRSKAEAAAEAVRDINPDVTITPMEENVLTGVGLGLFREVNVVIGCLDNREARLWVNRQCWRVGTPWVDGGIQEISGVAKVFVPPDGACYECAMTENDYRLINLRYSCPLLKQEDIQAGKVPTAPTISSIIAGLQTQEALKLLHGMPTAAGAALVFNGESNQFYQTKFQHREDCLSHDPWSEPRETSLTPQSTAAELFALAGEYLSERPLKLRLDHDLVLGVNCEACGHAREIMRPLPLVGMREAECENCKVTLKPQFCHLVEQDTELAGRKLEELGVPNYHILRVESADQSACFLMAK